MSLCVLTIASLLLAAPQEEKITFSCLGASVESTLDQLSKATSLKLEAAKDLKGMPLIVAVKDMNRQELLDSIADVMSARWTQNGEVWILAPDSSKRKLLAQSARSNQEKTLRELLPRFGNKKLYSNTMERTLSAMEGLKKTTNSEEQAQFVGQLYSMPTSGMGAYATSGVAVEDLINLAPGQRVVYSPRPTAMQRSLTPKMRGAMGDYNNLIQSFNSRVKEIGFSPSMILDKGLRDYAERMLKLQQTPNDGYIDISAYETPGQYGIWFRERGKNTGQQVSISTTGAMASAVLGSRDAQFNAFLEQVGREPIKVSDRAKKMLAIVTPGSGGTRTVVIDGVYYGLERPLGAINALSPQEQEDALRPERVDPLSWYIGPAIGQITDSTGLNFVLSPPDSCLARIGVQLSRTSVDSRVFLSNLYNETRMAMPDLVSVNKKTLILRQDFSGYPTVSRAVNRYALKEVLEDLQLAPFMGPSQAKTLGYTMSDLARSGSPWYSVGSKPALTYGFAQQSAYEFMKLLDSELLRRMSAGQSISVGQLSGDQRDKLVPLIFGPSNPFARVTNSSGVHDVTEVFPNGLPSDATLTIRPTPQFNILAWKIGADVARSNSFLLMQAESSKLEDYSGFIALSLNLFELTLTYRNIVWGPSVFTSHLDFVGQPVSDWRKLPSNVVQGIRNKTVPVVSP